MYLKIFNKHQLIKIFFLLIFINYSFFSIRHSLRENPWIAGDWLMNYEAGILRRGLSGEIILLLSNISSINPTYLLIFFQISLYCFFLYFFIKILNKKIINIWFLFLLLSPATIAFTFYDPLVIGRKEVIFFTFYTIYISIFLNDLKISVFKVIFYFSIGFIFVLIHEIFIFFSLFFVFTKYFSIYKKNIKIKINYFLNELSLIFGSFIAFLILLFFSTNEPEVQDLVCNRLLNNGLSPEICKGALTEIVFSKYVNSYKSFGLIDYILSYNYLRTYLISLILFFLPLYIFLLKQKINKKQIKLFTIFIIIQLIFLVSIFVVVNDWGRYLNIYFILILVFVSNFFLRKNLQELKKFNYKNLLIVLILLLYSLSWHMPHCCQKNLGKGMVSFKERILYRINNPTNYNDFSRKVILKFLGVNEHN